ncbi:MAG: thioredoxin family protein [Sphingobacteriales bacterium]|nr:thioredoxin family protein [Sphingobacteriales bacterium]
MNQFFYDKVQASTDYATYRAVTELSLSTMKNTDGSELCAEMAEYIRLNIQRMNRLDKTAHLNTDLEAALKQLRQNYIWLIISEGWCGDASQTVPVWIKAAEAANRIECRLILRDQHPDLIEKFLTNGGKAIPIVLCLDADNYELVAVWGPRPAPLQEKVNAYKKDSGGKSFEDFVTEVHTWYANDKTQTLQQEMLKLVRELE